MTLPSPLTILVHECVTGGGMAGEPLPESWAAEGRAMRRTLAADFARVDAATRVIVTLDQRFAPDDGPWTTVSIEPDSYLERLRDLARRADYTVLVAPETTGVLERLTVEIEEAGGRVLGSTSEAVALTADKSALARWFERNEIPTPRSQVVDPRAGLPADWPYYPAVLKPVDGAGSVDTFRIAGPSSLPDAARSLASALLQPLAPGVAMSAVFLVSSQGEARLIATGRQRMTVEDGRFVYEGGTIPVACPDAWPVLRKAVASVVGLRGFVGVDFVWDADRREATVLEINPRATTSCVGLCRLLPPGLLARAWLAGFADATGWDDAIDRVTRALADAPRVRFDAAGTVSEDDSK
ncbi:MAG: ATP-grasp domain-containing protein [Paludisphaera borealis]|uniref:ATP-grasp domain-containing protein n=1 Tax=Paludisphaera borealis TaxID=1387353 RepID=UPI002851D3A8|nr:ATP-grasp domain-containing protein [Paludisphaera borealis]MDR3621014.1 ATP-grasp domain-containing protein [Paludisphaera borealis]